MKTRINYFARLKSGLAKLWKKIGFMGPADKFSTNESEESQLDGEDPADFWRNQIDRLKRRVDSIKDRENLIAFYGSSSIRLWVHMQSDLRPSNVANLGFGGSNFSWCAYYFDEVFGTLEPVKIVLYAGENDLGEGKSPEVVLADCKRLCLKIRKRYPRVALALISIKPSVAREALLPEIIRTNALLEHLVVHDFGGQYINVFGQMIGDNQKPRPELYMSDGLHLNKAGYAIWSNTVRKALFT